MFGKNKKEPDEIARVDGQIFQVESQKNDHFRELGKLYYEENKDKNEDNGYKDINDKIKECDARLVELGDEKLRLQGLVRCKSCNASVSIGSMFCNHCGAKIEDLSGDSFALCAGCGKSFGAEMEFCPYCGKKRG